MEEDAPLDLSLKEFPKENKMDSLKTGSTWDSTPLHVLGTGKENTRSRIHLKNEPAKVYPSSLHFKKDLLERANRQRDDSVISVSKSSLTNTESSGVTRRNRRVPLGTSPTKGAKSPTKNQRRVSLSNVVIDEGRSPLKDKTNEVFMAGSSRPKSVPSARGKRSDAFTIKNILRNSPPRRPRYEQMPTILPFPLKIGEERRCGSPGPLAAHTVPPNFSGLPLVTPTPFTPERFDGHSTNFSPRLTSHPASVWAFSCSLPGALLNDQYRRPPPACFPMTTPFPLSSVGRDVRSSMYVGQDLLIPASGNPVGSFSGGSLATYSHGGFDYFSGTTTPQNHHHHHDQHYQPQPHPHHHRSHFPPLPSMPHTPTTTNSYPPVILPATQQHHRHISSAVSPTSSLQHNQTEATTAPMSLKTVSLASYSTATAATADDWSLKAGKKRQAESVTSLADEYSAARSAAAILTSDDLRRGSPYPPKMQRLQDVTTAEEGYASLQSPPPPTLYPTVSIVYGGPEFVPDSVVSTVACDASENGKKRGRGKKRKTTPKQEDAAPDSYSESGTEGDAAPESNSESGTEGDAAPESNSESGTEDDAAHESNPESGTEGDATPESNSESDSKYTGPHLQMTPKEAAEEMIELTTEMIDRYKARKGMDLKLQIAPQIMQMLKIAESRKPGKPVTLINEGFSLSDPHWDDPVSRTHIVVKENGGQKEEQWYDKNGKLHVKKDHRETSRSIRRTYGRYICIYCTKRFSDATDMVRHTRTHTLVTPFVCELCTAKDFTQQVTLEEHQKKTHGIMPPPKGQKRPKSHICERCGILFKVQEAYIQHLKMEHPKHSHLRRRNDKRLFKHVEGKTKKPYRKTARSTKGKNASPKTVTSRRPTAASPKTVTSRRPTAASPKTVTSRRPTAAAAKTATSRRSTVAAAKTGPLKSTIASNSSVPFVPVANSGFSMLLSATPEGAAQEHSYQAVVDFGSADDKTKVRTAELKGQFDTSTTTAKARLIKKEPKGN